MCVGSDELSTERRTVECALLSNGGKAAQFSVPLTLRTIGFRFTQRTVAIKISKKDSRNQFGIQARVE